jgi:hypothetical protein
MPQRLEIDFYFKELEGDLYGFMAKFVARKPMERYENEKNWEKGCDDIP